MKFRDVGIFFAVLIGICVLYLLGAVLGVRELEPNDFDEASIAAAFVVVLCAIREDRAA